MPQTSSANATMLGAEAQVCVNINMQLEALLLRRRSWLRTVEEPATTAEYEVTISPLVPARVNPASICVLKSQLRLQALPQGKKTATPHYCYSMRPEEAVRLLAMLQRCLSTFQPAEWCDSQLIATLREWISWDIPRNTFDAVGRYHGLRVLSLDRSLLLGAEARLRLN